MSCHLYLQIVGKGPPLVLLHGWGSHSGIWQPLMPELSENFQLFLIDLPGFGKSRLLTGDYDIDSLSAALLDVIPEKAAWLGWSLGGMIAWHIALQHPGRVTKLVTVASSPRFIQEENWPGVSPAVLQHFSSLLIQDYQKIWQDFLELQLRGSPKNPALAEWLPTQITEPSPDLIAALSSSLALLRDLDLRPALSRSQCPALHLFGSNDTLVPPEVIQKIQCMTPNGHCQIIKRAGHMPFLSQSDLFLQTVRKFLAEK